MRITKYNRLAVLCVGLFAQQTLAATTTTNDTWQKITAPKQQTVAVRGNKKKTIHPACAFSYNDSTRYHFFFKQGSTDKLVVFFNGGGVCWNDKTCLTSLKSGMPTYNTSITLANSPGASGLADTTNNANPFKGWSQVFIPYCTGDVHVGSINQNYTDVDAVLGKKNATIKVQHRGFDNFLAVREWLKKRYSTQSPLKKLAVTGASAGAYGAELNFPYLKDSFPQADTIMLSDAALGIVTQDFINAVFRKGGRWNTEETLARGIKGFKQFGNFKATTFNETVMNDLITAYPKSRFAQYSTAWDSIQTEFLHIMNSTIAGSPPNIVGIPWSLTPPAITFGEWNTRAEKSLTNIKASNYRFYLGSGSVHTVLGTNNFYNERSAENVLFSDWVKGLVTNNKKTWQSVTCSGECGSPI